jgi:ubiquinone/menaquinone biosynthesis C-methylase UbiE
LERISRIRELNNAHAKVYDTITGFPFYHKHLGQIIAELAPKRGKLYLDLGCGTGNLLAAAKKKGIPLTGVDLSAGMSKKAKGKGKDLVIADLHHLPFRDGCIDGITNVNVFYQLAHPRAFLREVYRVLKPGSKIVISTPKPRKLPPLLRFIPVFIKAFTRNPKLLTKIKKMTEYGRIDQKIIDLNPGTFYNKKELEGMLGDFEVEGIKNGYAGQNWLVSARKPLKG